MEKVLPERSQTHVPTNALGADGFVVGLSLLSVLHDVNIGMATQQQSTAASVIKYFLMLLKCLSRFYLYNV
jgi:hypothetical protein